MNDDRTVEERYAAWVRTVSVAHKQGWKCVGGWSFVSPNKQTIHDLSCADLDKLDTIEERGLMLQK